jgi:hypothetical protein
MELAVMMRAECGRGGACGERRRGVEVAIALRAFLRESCCKSSRTMSEKI